MSEGELKNAIHPFMDQHQHLYSAESHLNPGNSGKLPKKFILWMLLNVDICRAVEISKSRYSVCVGKS